MRVTKAVGGLLLAAVFVACDPGIDPMAPDVDPQFARSSKAPVAHVSAGGKLDISNLFPGASPETYGFSASVDANGNAKGQASMKWTIPSVKLHMEISCLSVAGNQAWVGGTVTHTHDETIVAEGTHFVWSVVDNGEGKKASGPDQMSFFFFTGDPGTCNNQFDVGTPLDWQSGNVQVKGETGGGGGPL